MSAKRLNLQFISTAEELPPHKSRIVYIHHQQDFLPHEYAGEVRFAVVSWEWESPSGMSVTHVPRFLIKPPEPDAELLLLNVYEESPSSANVLLRVSNPDHFWWMRLSEWWKINKAKHPRQKKK